MPNSSEGPLPRPIPANTIVSSDGADLDLSSKFNIVGFEPPRTFLTQLIGKPDAPTGSITASSTEVQDYLDAIKGK